MMEEDQPIFRPFTRESLVQIQSRISEEYAKKKELDKKRAEGEVRYEDDDLDDSGPHPDAYLEQGMPLPIRMAAQFDPELAGVPLEDFDPYYATKATFVIVSKKKDIFRFSATDAVYLLSPWNPVRRVAIAVLTHTLFTFCIICTILTNCLIMVLPSSPLTESTEVLFTAVYTFESAVKVMARGFILENFTYLRDAWNWLDFTVITLAYVTMGINLGNLAALRTFRVLRALKTVAIVPGLKTIVGAVIESVKNLRDVIILTMFSLSVFALIGLQIYMGILTQICIKTYPFEEMEWTEEAWIVHNKNATNWWKPLDSVDINYPICGNSSGAGSCPDNYTCLQGFGDNPDYGYTSFDSFGWALLSAFRLMTQDFWESLYQQVLRAAGPWHMLFFILVIFLGSFYLVNLILAIVAMSYDELQKKAEEEDLALLTEAQAMKEEAEEAARMQEEEEEESYYDYDDDEIQTRKGSMRSEYFDDDECTPQDNDHLEVRPHGRRVSSFPGSPIYGGRETQRKHPYADDLGTPTPMSPDNGDVVLRRDSRKVSFGGASLPRLSASSMEFGHPRRERSEPLVVTQQSSAESEKRGRKLSAAHNNRDHLQVITKSPSRSRRGSYFRDDQFQYRSVEAMAMEDVLVLTEIVNQAGRQSKMSDRPASAMHYYDTEEDRRHRWKRIVFDGCMRFIDVFCVWDCGFPWSLFQNYVSLIVFDPFAELLITLAITVNTFFMALDHYGLKENVQLSQTLKTGNVVFTSIFAIECFMKLVAMSPKYYFRGYWNVFDFIIVFLSLTEMIFEDAGLPGISALRSFRLLRVFKLAKSWPTLNLLISIMGKTMGALGNLVFVLLIIIFIFAVMGTQLFGKNYFDKVNLFPDGELPRWNFTDFWHSFMIIFRVLCGEWIESMWDCMLVGDKSCVPFFLASVVIGNLVVLNLFLALLLSSFGASNLSSPQADAETNKLAEAFYRIARCYRWIKTGIRKVVGTVWKAVTCCKRSQTEVENAENEDGSIASGKSKGSKGRISKNGNPAVKANKGKLHRKARMVMNAQKLTNARKAGINGQNMNGKGQSDGKKSEKDGEEFSLKSYKSKPRLMNGEEISPDVIKKALSSEDVQNSFDDEDPLGNDGNDSDDDYEDFDETGEDNEIMIPSDEKSNEQEEERPQDCLPVAFYEKFPVFKVDGTPFGEGWSTLRLKTFRLIENKYFETGVIIMILLSSLALALEDVHLPRNPVLVDILYYMDRIFTIIFFLEMLTKWLALGFNTYFRNAWCWLDFVIVMVSLINFAASLVGLGSVQAFKTMRTLRALRPLRAMSRMQGMRVVVNALVQAIPSIFNVLLVCLIFWLIFAIMGVQLFNGKFYKCIDPVDQSRPDYRIITGKLECLANNMSWENSKINFDHVGRAYLSLFQVATFKGWIEIMKDATDSRQEDGLQPFRENNFVMYIYFVIFIIFGSFFTLNLFIGVIIDNFNEQKKKAGGSLEMFMTEDQKKYYNAMKKMGNKKPLKAIPKPKWRPQAIVFETVTNQKFDMFIMIFIGLNMGVMTLDHANQPESWENTLNYLNAFFIAVFTSECLAKIFALRYHYFKEPWNLFDFVVVILSIIGLLLGDLLKEYFVSPTLLRVVRVAKVGRVLRLVKGAKGIRTLLFALMMSLPALFNICLLLFLVMFIYAIFGMSFFMNVKPKAGGLDDVYNFRTFGQSIILLFQMSTSAGWNTVLNGITDEEECSDPDPELGLSGDCGSNPVGVAFLLSYLVISFLIIINMYIAVILENYSQATEEVQEGLTDDDYDMYYEIWAQFDPDGSQYIRYDQLSDFLNVLEPPLQIHKPNKYKIISFDIPICKGDMLYCVDILDSLTRDFFSRKGNAIGAETVELSEVQLNHHDRPGYEPISSTLWRQREDFCARKIQKIWRKYTRNRKPSKPSQNNENTKGNKGLDVFQTTTVIVNEVEKEENNEPPMSLLNQTSNARIGSPSIGSNISDI